jgi:hypothetical protein
MAYIHSAPSGEEFSEMPHLMSVHVFLKWHVIQTSTNHRKSRSGGPGCKSQTTNRLSSHYFFVIFLIAWSQIRRLRENDNNQPPSHQSSPPAGLVFMPSLQLIRTVNMQSVTTVPPQKEVPQVTSMTEHKASPSLPTPTANQEAKGRGLRLFRLAIPANETHSYADTVQLERGLRLRWISRLGWGPWCGHTNDLGYKLQYVLLGWRNLVGRTSGLWSQSGLIT